MKKITFLIRALTHGGSERQLVVLAKGLAAKGYDVSIVVFYGGGVFEKELSGSTVSLVNLDKKSRWDAAVFLWRLYRYFHKNKPDVLHGYLTVSNILVVLLKPVLKNTRIVMAVRASNLELEKYGWLEVFSYKIECKLSNYADAIISNSYAGKDHAIQNGFPKYKVAVVHNGINVDFFQYNKSLRTLLRNEWGISEKQTLIGIVGRLDPIKGHEVFIRAAAKIFEINQNVHFVCIGDGFAEYKEDLNRLVKDNKLEHVFTWAGSRTDMVAVYSALDIVTSASYGEGFPNVIGEAMACGKQCVVTNVGDSKAIINSLGEVIPAKDSEKLSDAWLRVISKGTQEKNKIIRNNIVANYSIETMLAKTEKVLNG